MNDHIIKAAQEAGIEFQKNRGVTGRITTATLGSQPIEKMERFYAIAFKAGMERAAEICDGQHEEDRPGDYAYAIRSQLTK